MGKLSFLKVELDFIPTKIIMYCYYGSKFMLLSFFVVFLKSFGINPEQAGIITGCRSAAQTIGGMFLGWLVDYTKLPRTIFVVAVSVLISSLLVMPLTGYFITNTNGIPIEHLSANAHPNFTKIKNQTLGFADWSYHIYVTKNSVLFWCFLVFSIVFGFSDGIHGLIDGSIMNHVKNNGKGRTNYSYQRLWGSLGYGTIPIMAGILLDIFKNSYFSYYMPVFYLFSFLNIIMLVCLILGLKPEKDKLLNDIEKENKNCISESKSKGSILEMILKTICNLEMVIILWNAFLNGAACLCQYGFIYLLMQEDMTNATKTIMGVSFIAYAIVEAIIAPFVKGIRRQLGSSFISMSISLFGYSSVFFLFYFTKDGLFVVFINAIAGVTYPFYLYTAQEEIFRISDKACLSTIFTFDRGVYSGLGIGVGGVIAGSLYKTYGGRIMYLSVGIFYAICAFKMLIYGIYKNYNMKKKNNSLIQAEEKDVL